MKRSVSLTFRINEPTTRIKFQSCWLLITKGINRRGFFAAQSLNDSDTCSFKYRHLQKIKEALLKKSKRCFEVVIDDTPLFSKQS